MSKQLKRYSIFELIIMALLAALGLATKPIIVPLAHMISGPLFIPGGALAGGFYMFWIVLAYGIVQKRGAASLTAFIQAIIVMITGSFGSHGLVSLLTYSLPGIMIDIVFVLMRRHPKSNSDYFLAGVIANISGTYLSNLVFFRLPIIPLLLSLASAILSGGLGGLIAYKINKQLKKSGFGDYLDE